MKRSRPGNEPLPAQASQWHTREVASRPTNPVRRGRRPKGRLTVNDLSEPMLSVEDTLRRLTEAVAEALAFEELAPEDALGRTLSEPLQSPVDLPPWDNSAMDGYGVRAQDTGGASPETPVRLRVVGEVRAGGASDLEVPPGCAVRVATGAPVPPSVDAVVPVEFTIDASEPGGGTGTGPRARWSGFRATEPLAELCLVTRAAMPGDHIRSRGGDVRSGTRLLEAGVVLGPAQVALAAGVGLSHVRVSRRPIVGVLATGDELREPGQDLGRSGIPDANRPGLLAACRSVGATAVDLGIARDSLESVVSAVAPAIESVDAVIVSGGVSLGPYDVVRAAFETMGHVDVWRVAIQPGKPFTFARSHPRRRDGRRVPMFGLPGNPVSTLVTFELFVRPVLERLQGRMPDGTAGDRAVTADRLASDPARRGFVRVKIARDDRGGAFRDDRGRLRVSLAGGQGSHMLSALAVADALAIVPEGIGRLEPGDEVAILWLRP
jgi:molybdopterin molybdotransferase